MRVARDAGRLWLSAMAAGLIWLIAIVGGGINAAAQQRSSATQQQLTQQLQKLRAEGDTAPAAQVSTLLTKMADNQRQLHSLNVRLMQNAAQLTQLKSHLQEDRGALMSLVSTAYLDGSGTQQVAQALAAPNMSEFFASATLPASVADQVAQLVHTMRSDQQRLHRDQVQLLTDESQAQNLEKQLGSQSQQLLAQLTAPPPSAVIQVAATAPGGSGGSWTFAFGNCTYWAAMQWEAHGWTVNWGGDAYQWWANAAAAGHAEGSVPEVGAIVVWPPGADGASDVGHVAYVISVGSGSFEVSEMNFTGGFDTVDYRTVPDGAGYDGFIYPPGG